MDQIQNSGADDTAIRLLVNGVTTTVDDVEPTLNLLSFLRNRLKLCGTKEGCAEGDCGACTVVVGELHDGQLKTKTINACIQWLPALDGRAVFTVEYLRAQNGHLHPAQQSMVDCHGSQCGFCTPGFVMSLWQLYNSHQKRGTRATDADLRCALDGNLCRCTGYKPVIDAGDKMFELPEVVFDEAAVVKKLQAIQRSDALIYEYEDSIFHAPVSLSELTRLRRDRPDAALLAGCTDMGLWVNKQFREIKDIVYVGQVRGFDKVDLNEDRLRIEAGVSLADAYEALLDLYPQVAQMHERFASTPIRNAGTLGGNIANGSPIGDSMPWLIAVSATVELANVSGVRNMLLQDFYLDYMKTALQDDEVLTAIEVPKPDADQQFRTYKVAKRYDSDISAVCAAFSLRISNDVITDAIIAYGGMAAIPRRAPQCEQALLNNNWDESTLHAAQLALSNDYRPLSDMRASAANRLQLAQNLLQRFYIDTRSQPTSQTNNAPLSVWELSP